MYTTDNIHYSALHCTDIQWSLYFKTTPYGLKLEVGLIHVKLLKWEDIYHKKILKIYNKRPMGLDALLKNQLGHGPRFQKLHIHSLSTPGGLNLGYLCSTGSGFRDMGPFSKLPYLAMKLGK